jgi:hypothetical protein
MNAHPFLDDDDDVQLREWDRRAFPFPCPARRLSPTNSEPSRDESEPEGIDRQDQDQDQDNDRGTRTMTGTGTGTRTVWRRMGEERASC